MLNKNMSINHQQATTQEIMTLTEVVGRKWSWKCVTSVGGGKSTILTRQRNTYSLKEGVQPELICWSGAGLSDRHRTVVTGSERNFQSSFIPPQKVKDVPGTTITLMFM